MSLLVSDLILMYDVQRKDIPKNTRKQIICEIVTEINCLLDNSIL